MRCAQSSSSSTSPPRRSKPSFIYAREDGHLASITMWAYGRGCVLLHTFEQATGTAYEHKLEPNGRVWFNGRAQPLTRS